MRLSLFEIEATVRKACLGSGLSFGLAEDIGKASVWLAARGYDGVGTVIDALQSITGNCDIHEVKDGLYLFKNTCMTSCGPSAIDLLIGEKSCTQVCLSNANSVLLLVGLAGVSAEQNRMKFHLVCSNKASINVSVTGVYIDGSYPKFPGDILMTGEKVSQLKNTFEPPKQGAEIDDSYWREAELLAAKTYVPESQASRTGGAGAGLTDND